MLLVSAVATRAQVLISLLLGDKLNSPKIEFGLEGGANWSSIKNLTGAKSSTTFNLGFYFDFKLKNPAWMINTGVIVKSAMGARNLTVYPLGDADLDSAFAGGTVTRKIDYFNVPVLIKYSFDNHIYIKSGIQLGLRYNARDIFRRTVKEDDDLKYELKTKEQFQLIDAGLAIGLGYRLLKGNGINIGIKYYYGLVNINSDGALPKQFNRSFYVTGGIPIGRGKKM